MKSKIEWTECTWNPVTGCTKISSGCQNCYAFKMANRLKLMGSQKYRNGFDVTLHEYCLDDPLKIRKPSFIFVNSMSDLFHEQIPTEFIMKVFEVMNKASWHTFQILTKRSERLTDLSDKLCWTNNIWQGVTVESGEYKSRIDDLRTVPAAVRFISFEPLIGPVNNINFKGIDWAIVGGESGPKARDMETNWVLDIKEECEYQKVLFYFKQWGGINKKRNGRTLLGTTWDARPERLIR
ncbi:MAG: phage Gp37/Gp68 family protein [Syntrophomonadaceae bacterium]|nr:phage Gp37/Gp68 family protein [Syntrophomonadaceae bacterium]